MSTWEEVKAAAAYNAEVDDQVLAFLAQIQAELEALKSRPGGPSAEEYEALRASLSSKADEVKAAIETKEEIPTEEPPAEEPKAEETF